MKKFICPLIYLLALWLTGISCSHRQTLSTSSQTGDTIPLRYAENLTLVAYPDYTVATLRNPWDTLKILHTYILVPKETPLPEELPEGTVVRTPLSKSVIYSSVHCGLMDKLGAFGSIGGVCDLKYIKLPAVQDGVAKGTIADCGDGMNPDMEKIIDLHPDAILLSPFENSGGYGRIEKLNVPIIECADYMETSALGRAEWMRFYGLLFGVVPKADSLFAEVDSRYGQLKKRAALSSVSLSVVSELKSGSAWYVPGGRSTMGGLFNDACGRYVFAEDRHSGSVPLAFETVFDKAADADVWTIKYNRDRDMTYSDLQADYIGYTGFKAFKTRNIYGCNTAKVPFYEETPFRPDYLLADLIQILHPEIGDLGGLRYFCKLNEE
ncbi:ABC transporter substrate-binding protein [Bacteroides helcogenes]|uniref:Periplasmic binding protein n=1 Tax=Bacteroides helcogenes (strain ATCC 35417 / DSM 20613 / JCM 6297 / CCUG 15421 / P 36-108) TaxID=693979 RepID=E6SNJ4_BACT6|nr:ABC transporter substrate-binding protein [Bacteroides helcogenes]ADV43743.1 periplasmic binding protein [Bacteroides helcogenes P 36-108]MDY5237607.1 ABC transporter substrate-binding protein [Bacteroides helcogenes]